MTYKPPKIFSEECGEIAFIPLAHTPSPTGVDHFYVQSSGATGPFGTIIYHEVRQQNYTMCYSRYLINKDVTFVISQNSPPITFGFVLKNGIAYKLTGFPEDFIQHKQFNIFYAPQTICECNFLKGEEYVFFTVSLTEMDLKSMKSRIPLSQPFLEKVERDQPAVLSCVHLPMTSQIETIIDELLYDLYEEPIQRIRMENNLNTLLDQALNQALLHLSGNKGPAFSEEDLNRIRYIHSYLIEHLDNPGTLKSLAREAGTNILKLKLGFKILYGTTVFAFVREKRMQKAVELLKSTNWPIYKIAEFAGYRSPANFATAFKKWFGYPPSSLRS